MKKAVFLLPIAILVFQINSCKKDSSVHAAPEVDLNTDLINFSVNGQVVSAAIDTTYHTISIVVPRTYNQHSLTVNFTLGSQVKAEINHAAISSGATVDFTKPVTFTLVSGDNKHTLAFSVSVETDLQYMGVTGNILAEKSLDKTYGYYFDQWDGSQYQAINCGPASAAMALKWADSTSAATPADARITIPESDGWWYTADVQQYLKIHGINSTVDTLADVAAEVQKAIDNNNELILCLDMFDVPENGIDYMHTEKFYFTNAAG